MSIPSIPFISGSGEDYQLPLNRFLPTLPKGVIQEWLWQNVKKGSWILDPFGTNPALALEAARAGYKVLVACNNPILAYILQFRASAPQPELFQAAIADLAASKKGEDKLEYHFRNLYHTICPRCAMEIEAEAFIWKKSETLPFAKLIKCPQCGESGEFPTTAFDHDHITHLGSDAMHRARALQRVVDPGSELESSVKSILTLYLTRPLYVATNMINRVEMLTTTPEKKEALFALALNLCDESSALWPYPGGRSKPRQLVIPPQFRESNLWHALEACVPNWTDSAAPVEVTRWPKISNSENSICLFPRQIRHLMPLENNIHPEAILALFPRPNQALWALSALWSGWLWGKQAVKPLINALDRRRYDWNWHAAALESALSIVSQHVKTDVAVFGIAPDLNAGLVLAISSALQHTGFRISGIALNEGTETLQITGNFLKEENSKRTISLEADIFNNTRSLLIARNEPVRYLPLFTTALMEASQSKNLPAKLSQPQLDDPGTIISRFGRILADPTHFFHYGSTAPNTDTGWWSLKENPGDNLLSIKDNIEIEIINLLQHHHQITYSQIFSSLCSTFPGYLTPDPDWVLVCLKSYGEISGDSWSIKPEESPQLRNREIAAVSQTLGRLENQFNMKTDNKPDPSEKQRIVKWIDQQGILKYTFFIGASAVLSQYVNRKDVIQPDHAAIFLPESRMELVAYKIDHDPQLQQKLKTGWKIIHFRDLFTIAAMKELSFQVFSTLLEKESSSNDDPIQLSIF